VCSVHAEKSCDYSVGQTHKSMALAASQTLLRTLGWVYQNAETGTVPVYRCYSSALKTHFASNQSDCEGRGTMEWRLGYALAS